MHKNNLDMIYPSQLNRVVVTNMFSVFLWDIWDILKTREDIIKKKIFLIGALIYEIIVVIYDVPLFVF